MKTLITFRQIDSSDAVKNHIHEKIERLEKYVKEPAEVHVVLSSEKLGFEAEFVVHAKGIQSAYKASQSDIYVAIDDALAKAEKALRRNHKKKVKARTKPHHAKVPISNP